MCTIPAGRVDILTKRAFAHVATIGPQGEPQTSPVWIDWDGQYLKFSHTTSRQKYRNLQREPRVSLSAYDPADPYRYIEIRGKLVRIEPDEDYEFINKMSKKYIDEDVYPGLEPGEERIVVYIKPERVTPS